MAGVHECPVPGKRIRAGARENRPNTLSRTDTRPAADRHLLTHSRTYSRRAITMRAEHSTFMNLSFMNISGRHKLTAGDVLVPIPSNSILARVLSKLRFGYSLCAVLLLSSFAIVTLSPTAMAQGATVVEIGSGTLDRGLQNGSRRARVDFDPLVSGSNTLRVAWSGVLGIRSAIFRWSPETSSPAHTLSRLTEMTAVVKWRGVCCHKKEEEDRPN